MQQVLLTEHLKKTRKLSTEKEITVDHPRRKEEEVGHHCSEQRVCRSSKQPFLDSPSPFSIFSRIVQRF